MRKNKKISNYTPVSKKEFDSLAATVNNHATVLNEHKGVINNNAMYLENVAGLFFAYVTLQTAYSLVDAFVTRKQEDRFESRIKALEEKVGK